MSTEIPRVDVEAGVVLVEPSVVYDDALYIGANGRGSSVVPRADFLAAVAAECGVLVIDRADLPEVEPPAPGYSGYVGLDGPGSAESNPIPLMAPEWHEDQARRHLALAQYVRLHPPVDEAQVEATYDLVQDVFRDAGLSMGDVDYSVRMDLARRLVQRGVQVEVRP